MSSTQRTVLVTGCSDNSLGSALALALQKHGDLQVFAAARDTAKMTALSSAGIKTLELDVTSQESIKALVEEVTHLTKGKLDILINSVGGGHYQPFMHLDISKAKRLFDVNVWGFVETTQAFLPLLLANAEPGKKGRKSVVVNNTSISSVLRTPYHSAYSASKAAMAMFNDIQRIELEPLGIKVVDLKTGSLESNFGDNKSNPYELPEDSPYQPIKDEVMKVITGETTEAYAEDRKAWAKNVVKDLMKNPDSPPPQIWRGGAAGTIQTTNKMDSILPDYLTDGSFQGLGGLDKLGKMLEKKGKGA
ncbi:IBR finger domain protein (short-chain dehydrogenase) [Stagonosporopsis vannaccii]|nr:IBR finger domain protein (short-chain dehydrogenase) [Stagonosporopsis vannaccii]